MNNAGFCEPHTLLYPESPVPLDAPEPHPPSLETVTPLPVRIEPSIDTDPLAYARFVVREMRNGELAREYAWWRHQALADARTAAFRRACAEELRRRAVLTVPA